MQDKGAKSLLLKCPIKCSKELDPAFCSPEIMEQIPAMQSDRGRGSEGEEDGDEEWILAKFGDIEKK